MALVRVDRTVKYLVERRRRDRIGGLVVAVTSVATVADSNTVETGGGLVDTVAVVAVVDKVVDKWVLAGSIADQVEVAVDIDAVVVVPAEAVGILFQVAQSSH